MNKFKLISICIFALFFITKNLAYADSSIMDSNIQGSGIMLQQQQTMLQHLGTADKNYDLRFLDMMIIHHQGAVDMAKDVLKKSKRKELKQMANNIISSQTKEIEQMKAWKKQWYNK